jgi:hypothetical protein
MAVLCNTSVSCTNPFIFLPRCDVVTVRVRVRVIIRVRACASITDGFADEKRLRKANMVARGAWLTRGRQECGEEGTVLVGK